MKTNPAQNIINQIIDIEIVVNRAIEIIDNKEYDNLSSYLDFSNKLTDKDKEWLAYELGMPLDEIEATIDDMEYVDKHGLNKKIFGL